jgi:cation transport regulator ChaC
MTQWLLVAYKIPENEWETVKGLLDYREKGGYSIDYVDVYTQVGDQKPGVEKVLSLSPSGYNLRLLLIIIVV